MTHGTGTPVSKEHLPGIALIGKRAPRRGTLGEEGLPGAFACGKRGKTKERKLFLLPSPYAKERTEKARTGRALPEKERRTHKEKRLSRRQWLALAGGTAVAWGIPLAGQQATLTGEAKAASGAASDNRLLAGQAFRDITPPLGIELAGFHRTPGNERRIRGIRQPAEARALVLRMGQMTAAVVSLDLLAVSADWSAQTAQAVEKATGIPAAHVRFCATHSHSMPTLRYCRQWGAISPEYAEQVRKATVEAVQTALEDLAPARLEVGRAMVIGGNFNRTAKPWKTDAEFGKDSTDADRWLDTTLHVLRFRREGKPELVWYHFSSHPVCYRDELAGPDWPGLVAQWAKADGLPTVCYLQGHAGDVNPGDGQKWIGDPEPSAKAVYEGLKKALAAAQPTPVEHLDLKTQLVDLPLDMELFQKWIDQYRAKPEECNRGHWVDGPFAADWFQGAAKWNLKQTTLPVRVSALALGREVALVFHPAELYSYYGLAIRRDSPFRYTLVVGYTDDCIGYLPDPKAYQAGEYAAIVVPKILDLPPFRSQAASLLAQEALQMLRAVWKVEK